jgi:hypothetical protein
MNNRRKTILKAYADCLGIGRKASYGQPRYMCKDYIRHRNIIKTQKRVPHKKTSRGILLRAMPIIVERESRINNLEFRRND